MITLEKLQVEYSQKTLSASALSTSLKVENIWLQKWPLKCVICRLLPSKALPEAVWSHLNSGIVQASLRNVKSSWHRGKREGHN